MPATTFDPLQTHTFASRELLTSEQFEQELQQIVKTEGTIDEHRGLQLSRETILRILELFSRRQEIADEDRRAICQMIRDLNKEIVDSKYAAAGIYLGFACAGGLAGMAGALRPNTGLGEGLKALSQTASGWGQFSNQLYAAEDIKPETAKQVYFGDMNSEEGASSKIDQTLARILQAVELDNQARANRRTH